MTIRAFIRNFFKMVLNHLEDDTDRQAIVLSGELWYACDRLSSGNAITCSKYLNYLTRALEILDTYLKKGDIPNREYILDWKKRLQWSKIRIENSTSLFVNPLILQDILGNSRETSGSMVQKYDALATIYYEESFEFQKKDFTEKKKRVFMMKWIFVLIAFVGTGVTVYLLARQQTGNTERTVTPEPEPRVPTDVKKALCLIVAEKELAGLGVSFAPEKLVGKKVKELVRVARYFGVLPIDEAKRQEAKVVAEAELTADAIEGEAAAWEEDSDRDVYLRLEIAWKERPVSEREKFPILNSIEDNDSISLYLTRRLNDRSSWRSWLHRV